MLGALEKSTCRPRSNLAVFPHDSHDDFESSREIGYGKLCMKLQSKAAMLRRPLFEDV